jgi:hypothetical protein
MLRSNRQAFHGTEERHMNQVLKVMLRRCLMTLGGIFVWAKALAGGRADGETQSMPETDQKAADQQQKPNREPK